MLAQDWLLWPDLDRVVASTASRYRVSRDDLPDIAQEVRLTIWRAGGNRIVNATWIFKVVGSRVLDYVRARAVSQASQFAGGAEGSPEPPCAEPELVHLLEAALSRLPPKLKRFYDLHYGEGMSEREIVRKTRLSRGSVRWLDRRLRRELTGSGA